MSDTPEETGLRVELTGPVAALGGPRFRVTYANGDQTAYVCVVYQARVTGGTARPDGVETDEVRWFHPDELQTANLGTIAAATLDEMGWLRASQSEAADQA